MSLRVHVIGLGGQRPASELADLLRSGPVLARNDQSARGWLGEAFALEGGFDDLFERGPAGAIIPAIIERFERVKQRADECVYLVPGSGVIGDATVEALYGSFEVTLLAGQLDVQRPFGDAQVTDALALAIAEELHPFDSGQGVIDPARPLIVTNLAGSAVKPLARRRIERAIGGAAPDPDESGTVVVLPQSEPGAVRSWSGFERIISMLRSPEGCPWDREQTVETLIPMMLEEIDELRAAFAAEGAAEQADELGDVLLHIAMIAQVARERHDFGMEEVLDAISGKMVRRHPHVFGDVEVSSIEELYEVWQQVKDSERSGGGSEPGEQVSGG